MATLRIPRGSSPVLRGKIWEGKADESAVLDLTGVPLAVVDSTLGSVTPSIAVTDAVAGEYELTFPDTASLALARSYKMRIRVGAQGAPATFTTPFIEVVAS